MALILHLCIALPNTLQLFLIENLDPEAIEQYFFEYESDMEGNVCRQAVSSDEEYEKGEFFSRSFYSNGFLVVQCCVIHHWVDLFSDINL